MTKNKQESAEKLKNGLHIKRLWNPTACDFQGFSLFLGRNLTTSYCLATSCLFHFQVALMVFFMLSVEI